MPRKDYNYYQKPENIDLVAACSGCSNVNKQGEVFETPEISVEDIVKIYKGDDGYCTFTEQGLTKLLKAERQKRDEVVEAERERWIKAVGEKIDLPTRKLILNAFQEGVDYTKCQYDRAIRNFTQTNSTK